MHAIPATMKWKIIPLPQQHQKKYIRFYAETVAGNLHFRNTKKAAALTATQDLIQNAVYMRIFTFAVQMQRIQNNENGFWKVRKHRNLMFQRPFSFVRLL